MTTRFLPTSHGPELLPEGGVTFRLWAPTAEQVHLVLDGEQPLPMHPTGDGWRELTHETARPGDRYSFLIDRHLTVPDPASRFQPEDVDGPSEIVNPEAFNWADGNWRGRSWEEAVIYELHVGTFSHSGDYTGVEEKLDYLASLGITAIEFMPLSDFAGARGWGYDGVLPYAPDSAYGRPEDLKRLIDAAHARGIMVFLDVVYNHFGPSGNYLHAYAETFFTERYHTPWGAAINLEGHEARPVRDFFIENALYWLMEYHFDGLRFDAVHAITDRSTPHFLEELAETVRASLPNGRHVHLILENDHNQARYLERDGTHKPKHFTAQWNDDIHHVLHVLLTGEIGGYYKDYRHDTIARLGRCLTQGFDYQGKPSEHRDGQPRGEPSAHLPPGAFVSFIQNHDQIGNRAMGDRLTTLTDSDRVKLGLAVLLLNPSTPMLYMGEEWGSTTPFLYFCDFEGELAEAVRNGRRKEFESFPEFSDPEKQKRIPDPNAASTFLASALDWQDHLKLTHKAWLEHVKSLLTIRREWVVPLLQSGWARSEFHVHETYGLHVHWAFRNGKVLNALINCSDLPLPCDPHIGDCVYGTPGNSELPGWTSLWTITEDA